MQTRVPASMKVFFTLLFVTIFLFTGIGASSAQDGPDITVTETKIVSPYLTMEYATTADGRQIVRQVINGPSTPPAGFDNGFVIEPMSMGAKLPSFPSFNWVFGCSAVSGAMIAGYYDRAGYANMYTGPTAAGVMPITDTSWPKWTDTEPWKYPSNPLIASRMGTDGLTSKGSIDDYWTMYGSYEADPFLLGSWSEHTWGTAIGDYMKTSQYMYYNTDGATSFYGYTEDEYPYYPYDQALTCEEMDLYEIEDYDGTFGRKLFYESKGYEVTDCYNQWTDNWVEHGFTFEQFKAEILAGHPVYINLAGHSVVGYGYGPGKTIYIRNTWDSNPNHTYSMTWGESYEGMDMMSVSVVDVTPPASPLLKSPAEKITSKMPVFTFSPVFKASKYQFRIFMGSSTTSLYKADVARSLCTSGWCKGTLTKALAPGDYTWQARAFVNGAWKAWSTSTPFTIVAPK